MAENPYEPPFGLARAELNSDQVPLGRLSLFWLAAAMLSAVFCIAFFASCLMEPGEVPAHLTGVTVMALSAAGCILMGIGILRGVWNMSFLGGLGLLLVGLVVIIWHETQAVM